MREFHFLVTQLDEASVKEKQPDPFSSHFDGAPACDRHTSDEHISIADTALE